MSEPLRYPVPWDVIAKLGPFIWHNQGCPFDEFTEAVARRIKPAPRVEGFEHLPDNPRFVLAANHYQRKGLWIVHIASLLTQIIRRRYGSMDPLEPSIRWIVTANWPPLRVGRIRIPSPGDVLLPRVAQALQCYPVSTYSGDAHLTARTVKRLLRDTLQLQRPIGIFPEGITGSADRPPGPPLPGALRLLHLLARKGLPIVPVRVSEADSRFVIRIGQPLLDPDLLVPQGLESIRPPGAPGRPDTRGEAGCEHQHAHTGEG